MKFSYILLLLSSSLAATEDQVKGCILGAALGDALGRVTEFIDTTDKIYQRYPKGVSSFNDFKKDDWVDGIAAYTDDTVLAKALLEEGRKDPNNLIANYAKRLKKIYGFHKYETDPWFNLRAHGPTCMKNALKLT